MWKRVATRWTMLGKILGKLQTPYGNKYQLDHKFECKKKTKKKIETIKVIEPVLSLIISEWRRPPRMESWHRDPEGCLLAPTWGKPHSLRSRFHGIRLKLNSSPDHSALFLSRSFSHRHFLIDDVNKNACPRICFQGTGPETLVNYCLLGN